ncbi:hypothetical protein [Paraconexibacter algicola]|uniref:hypothetical protein n=1 Tax=Paraconexibacter algicola TaxID=2133960 RepID=UPI001304947B|nr:hypothetical protein [Paraconexibacter algicola]
MSANITPIAEALRDLADGLPTVKSAFWPAPRQMSALPGVVVEVPSGTRTLPDERESQLFADDWDMDFPVTIYVDLADPVAAQLRIAEVVDELVAGVDANPSLNGTALEARVTSWERPAILEPQGSGRALMFVATVVSVLKLV